MIAPILQRELGLKLSVPPHFNSDRFGTFTRDIPRPGEQLETARLKAQAILEEREEKIALASEGSFGPHPSLPWLACDRELVLLLDHRHQLELVGQAISTNTNYGQQRVTTLDEAHTFAEKSGFPEHGLVVRPDRDQHDPLWKGITDAEQLQDCVQTLLQQQGNAWLETDMRAMYNPTRMQVIREATQDLVRKIRQTCPHCHWPGFDVVGRNPGLPCAWCGQPTLGILQQIYRCQSCSHEVIEKYPDGRETNDPSQCPYCNP
ncbi:hypothetical protein PN462_22960 [Spirulina sp. CS-785/01]|nr:DUF6671 family protein [Spirulina sp. CS-785/01]MDB9315990.1 hypothetical protein [Spirulina sp. CS-785/01]